MVSLSLVSTLRKARRPLYICHDRADADALCSAFLLSQVAPGEIAVGGSIRPDMDGVLATFGVDLVDWSDAQRNGAYDLHVIVDSFGRDQVEPCPERFILVDHHARAFQQGKLALAPSADALFHTEAPSCTWMIHERLKAGRVPISRQMALAVLCGFLGDNGLMTAAPPVLQAVARLMERHGLTMAEARRSMDPLAQPDPEPALEAIRRGRVIRVGPYKIYEATVIDVRQSYSVRNALLTFGFDAVVLRLDMEGHRAVTFWAAAQHVRRGLTSRVVSRLRQRFPGAAHWGSGFTEVESLDEAMAATLATMTDEFGQL